MSVDVSTLEIRVISDAVEQAEKRLRALEDQAGNTEKGASNLTGGFAKLAASVAATVSVMQGFEKIVSVAREFDVLNAGLVTATGSAEGAKVAFDSLQNFAATTPYSLQQVTEGFTKLVNYGLNPSEKALTAYGNTASALGKDLSQMVEAVADATTGEFERLKEFGIRSAKQGDEVSFTFRGVTTTVKNSTEEIENYLIALGENNFANAMTARMDTLDGALSNLSDSWDALFRNIAEQGAGDLIEQSVRSATNALSALNASLASGQTAGYISALTGLFSGFGTDAARSAKIADEAFGEFLGGTLGEISKFVDDALAEIVRLPADFRSWIQAATVQIVSNLQEVGSEFEALGDYVAAVFTDDTIEQASQRNLDRLSAIKSAREASMQDIIAERDASIKSFYDQIDAADKAKASFDAAAAAKGGVLGQFGQGGGSGVAGGSSASAGAAKKGGSGGADSGPNDNALAVENLALKLQQEEQLFSDSYARRYETQSAWDVINDQAMTTTFSRRMEQLAAEDEAMRARSDRLYAEAESDYQRNQNQLQAWRTSGLITEQRYNQLSEQNLIKFGKTKEQIEKAGQSRQLSNAAVFAGAALNIASTLFADSKPIAIAAALMSTYQGAANALATLPFPANIAAAATVVAAGIAQVNNIRSTSPGGGGGGGASYTPTSLPGTAGNDLQTSTLPVTAVQEKPAQTIYLALETDGRPAREDDTVKLSNLRPLFDALNEQAKLGNFRIVT